jgi:hypothetical protein
MRSSLPHILNGFLLPVCQLFEDPISTPSPSTRSMRSTQGKLSLSNCIASSGSSCKISSSSSENEWFCINNSLGHTLFHPVAPLVCPLAPSGHGDTTLFMWTKLCSVALLLPQLLFVFCSSVWNNTITFSPWRTCWPTDSCAIAPCVLGFLVGFITSWILTATHSSAFGPIICQWLSWPASDCLRSLAFGSRASLSMHYRIPALLNVLQPPLHKVARFPHLLTHCQSQTSALIC